MYKNKAFISYRHTPRDRKIAGMIQRRLEHYRIPKGIASRYGMTKIGKIFRDQTDLGAQPDLTEELCRELDESEFLIVICSPDAADSRWVPREIQYFLKNHSSSNLLPVLVDGDPTVVLPALFGLLEGLPVELKASDLRKENCFARGREISRLASALIGCGYDELVDREKQFRRKKTLIVAAAIMCLVTSAAAFYHFNSMQLKKSMEEKRAGDVKNLAVQSELSLQNRERFDALRHALEAFPVEENDDPVVGDAVYALQKAVNAYATGEEYTFIQTGEFNVDGQIEDWACMEDGARTWLAVLYDDFGESAMTIWNIVEEGGEETINRLYDLHADDFFEDTEAGIESFLLTADSIVWSSGNRLGSIDLKTGTSVWKTEVSGAYRQTVLAVEDDQVAIHVSTGGENGESCGGQIQLRNLVDGSMSGIVTVGFAEDEKPSTIDGYYEIPKVVFVADAENQGKCLIVEENDYFYEDEQDNLGSLRLLNPEKTESEILAQGSEIADFCLLDEKHVLLAVYEHGNEFEEKGKQAETKRLWLKLIDIWTGTEEWSTEVTDRDGEYVRILAGETPVLISDRFAASYDVDSGSLIQSIDFPSSIINASLDETISGNMLTAVASDGNYYIWDMREDKISNVESAFPSAVYSGVQSGEKFFLYCISDSSISSGDRIVLFQEDGGDPDLTRVSVPDFMEETDTECLITCAASGKEFVVVTGDGEAFGIDAVSGVEIWSLNLGTRSELVGINGKKGKMLVHTFSSGNGEDLFDIDLNDSDRAYSPGEDIWTIVSTGTGEARRVEIPVPESESSKEQETSHIECLTAAMTGDYLTGIVRRKIISSSADEQERIYITRTPLETTNHQTADVIDISDWVSADEDEFLISGNHTGSRAVCFCLKEGHHIADLLLYVDWTAQEIQTMSFEDDLVIQSDSLPKWNSDGNMLVVPDGGNKLWIIDLKEKHFRDSVIQISSLEMDEETGQELSGKSIIAGFDFHENDLVTVEAQGGRLWFREQNHSRKFGFNKNSDKRFNLPLPISSDNEHDPEALGGMEIWTEVSLQRTVDGTMLLEYGDEAFLINPEGDSVETALKGFQCYNPGTDTFLLKGNQGLYISRKYSVRDLIEKAEKILQRVK